MKNHMIINYIIKNIYEGEFNEKNVYYVLGYRAGIAG